MRPLHTSSIWCNWRIKKNYWSPAIWGSEKLPLSGLDGNHALGVLLQLARKVARKAHNGCLLGHLGVRTDKNWKRKVVFIQRVFPKAHLRLVLRWDNHSATHSGLFHSYNVPLTDRPLSSCSTESSQSTSSAGEHIPPKSRCGKLLCSS